MDGLLAFHHLVANLARAAKAAFGVGIGITMMHGRIHLSGLLVEGDVGALLAAQFATDRREQIAWLNFCHNLYIFMVLQYAPL